MQRSPRDRSDTPRGRRGPSVVDEVFARREEATAGGAWERAASALLGSRGAPGAAHGHGHVVPERGAPPAALPNRESRWPSTYTADAQFSDSITISLTDGDLKADIDLADPATGRMLPARVHVKQFGAAPMFADSVWHIDGPVGYERPYRIELTSGTGVMIPVYSNDYAGPFDFDKLLYYPADFDITRDKPLEFTKNAAGEFVRNASQRFDATLWTMLAVVLGMLIHAKVLGEERRKEAEARGAPSQTRFLIEHKHRSGLTWGGDGS